MPIRPSPSPKPKRKSPRKLDDSADSADALLRGSDTSQNESDLDTTDNATPDRRNISHHTPKNEGFKVPYSPSSYTPKTPLDSPPSPRRRAYSGGSSPESAQSGSPNPTPYHRRTGSGTPTPTKLVRPPLHSYQKASYITPTLDREPKSAEKDGNTDQNNMLIGGALVLVFVLVLGGAYLMKSSDDDAAVDETAVMLQRFQQEMQTFQSIFKQQSNRFWGVVKSQVKRIINENQPTNPAVILLGSSGHLADQTATCIAHKVAELVTVSFSAKDHLQMDASDLSGMSGADAKLKLDEDITGALGDGARAVVLLGLQQVDTEAAMMFHSFCDNTNAPHRRVAYLFTVQIPSDKVSGSLDAKQVEGHLEESWSHGINRNNLPALLSRVSNNVVIINEEDQATIQQHCRNY